jgi:hypothetical protein
VVVVAVLDVGNALESCREAATYLVLADKSAAPALGSARGLEDALLREVRHDRVEVVVVESVQDLAKHRGGDG